MWKIKQNANHFIRMGNIYIDNYQYSFVDQR